MSMTSSGQQQRICSLYHEKKKKAFTLNLGKPSHQRELKIHPKPPDKIQHLGQPKETTLWVGGVELKFNQA